MNTLPKFKELRYKIGAQFLAPIFNGDLTALDEYDSEALELFESLLPGQGHWASTNDRDEFSLCEVTGMYGPTEVLIWNYKEN